MKKITMKLTTLVSVMVMMASGLVYGKAVTGIAIFNHSVGARQLGMADATVGLSDDVNSIYYNPAGLATINKLELNAMYFDNIVDTKDEAISMVYPLGRGLLGKRASMGLGVRAYQGGDIEVIMLDSSDNITRNETLTAESDYMASLAYAEEVIHNGYFGLAVKGIRATLVEDYSANAFAMDAGVLYKTPLKGLSVGASILNVGTELKFIEEGDALPMRMVGGIGYQMSPMKSINVKLDADYIQEKDDEGRTVAGIELGLLDMVMVRCGYYVNSDLGSMTAGIGVKVGWIQLDYGYGMMDELGNLQRMSLSFKFGNGAAGEEQSAKKANKKITKVVNKKDTNNVQQVSSDTKNIKVIKKTDAKKKTATKKYSLAK